MAKTNWFRHKPVDIEEFLKIAQSDSKRITSTPFGARPGADRLVASTAVPWKNKGKAAMPEGAKKGLEKAIKISQKAAGTTGTITYHGKVYPKKAIKQKEIAGKITLE